MKAIRDWLRSSRPSAILAVASAVLAMIGYLPIAGVLVFAAGDAPRDGGLWWGLASRK